MVVLAHAVDSVLDTCIGSGGQSASVPVECPPNYHLRIDAAAVYRSAGGASSCPSSTDAACRHSSLADVVDGTCRRNESSCLLTVVAPTSPAPCDPATHSGDYFVSVDYRCQPGSTASRRRAAIIVQRNLAKGRIATTLYTERPYNNTRFLGHTGVCAKPARL